MKPLLILGIGNTIRGDDAIGIFCVRRLKESLKDLKEVEIKECEESGVGLLNLLEGYRKIIIIDGITTGRRKVGYIYKFSKKEIMNSSGVYSSHNLGLATIFKLAEMLNLEISEDISIYAIEIKKNFSFHEGISSSLERALERVESLVKKEIRNYTLNFFNNSSIG